MLVRDLPIPVRNSFGMFLIASCFGVKLYVAARTDLIFYLDPCIACGTSEHEHDTARWTSSRPFIENRTALRTECLTTRRTLILTTGHCFPTGRTLEALFYGWNKVHFVSWVI